MDKMTTETFRVSFPALLEEATFKGKPTGKRSVIAIFPKGFDKSKSYQEMNEMLDRALMKKFGKIPPNIERPWKKGKDKRDSKGNKVDGYEDGTLYLNLSTKKIPRVVDQNLEDIKVTSQIYAGCYGRAAVNAYYRENPSPAVAFGLVNFQKVSEGKPLGGGSSDPHDDFDAITTSSDTDDALNDLE